MRLRQTIEGLAQSMVQNGTSASVLINTIKSDSIAEMSRLLEEAEEQAAKAAQEAEDKKLQTQQMVQQMINEDKAAERELKRYEIDTNWDIAVMQQQGNNPQADLVLKMREHEDKVRMDTAKLKETERANKAKEEETSRVNDMKQEETTRHNKAVESKPKTTSK